MRANDQNEREGSMKLLLAGLLLIPVLAGTAGTHADAAASRADGPCGEGRRHSADGLE